MLSGFLITGLLYDARGAPGGLRSFYARRVLRIVPLYYGFLALVLLGGANVPALAIPLDVDALREHQVWYWTYLVNVAAVTEPFRRGLPFVHNHFWSLAVEEQFYLVWPFVLLLGDRRRLMTTCAALVVGAFFLRAVLVVRPWPDVIGQNAHFVLMPARMDALALGALLALAQRGRGGLARVAAWARPVALASAVVLTGLYVWFGELRPEPPIVATVGFSATSLFFAALLGMTVTAARGGALARIFSSRVMRWFGRYSYGLYVFHQAVGITLTYWAPRFFTPPLIAGSQIPYSVAYCAVALAATSALAWLSWHLVEKRFLALKARFPYRDAEPRTPVAALAPGAAVTAVSAGPDQ